MILVMDMISGDVVSADQGSREEKPQTAFSDNWNDEAERLGLICLPAPHLATPRRDNEPPADVLDWNAEDFVRAMERP